MPLVRAYLGPKFSGPVRDLWISCKEVVPAGLNSPAGPLTPGSIEFVYRRPKFGLNVDVLLDIEAYHFDDRAIDLEERAEAIRVTLNKLMPRNTYAIWLKLVNAGWASDSPDPDFDADMSMKAATVRARKAIAESKSMHTLLAPNKAPRSR